MLIITKVIQLSIPVVANKTYILKIPVDPSTTARSDKQSYLLLDLCTKLINAPIQLHLSFVFQKKKELS